MGSWKERYDSWHSCAHGVIQRFAQRQRRREQTVAQQRTMAVGFTITLLVFCVITTLAIAPRDSERAEPPTQMDCNHVLELMWQYHQGNLVADESHAVGHHMEHCDSCREVYSDAKLTGVWPERVGGEPKEDLVGQTAEYLVRPSGPRPSHP
ncbi:MAG: zf-HC2 domain-containing protein [Planctomycetota bacterium]|nr:MAG: zf-HC2 domain-containing protein [Planctomycetota bacterium]